MQRIVQSEATAAKRATIAKDLREKAAKLDAFRHITACRCALSFTARRDHHRHAFHVRLEVDVPGFPPIVVSREHDRDHVHADAHVEIRDAFAMARRELHLLQ